MQVGQGGGVLTSAGKIGTAGGWGTDNNTSALVCMHVLWPCPALPCPALLCSDIPACLPP